MEWMEDELESLKGRSQIRSLTEYAPIRDEPGSLLRGGNRLLNLTSNDYLGLSRHPAIVEAMVDALSNEGVGAGASRLVSGNRAMTGKLEKELAEWQQSEAALVAANGYMANVGVISSLAGRRDVVFSDRLNHASIVDGITLSRAEHVRYRHNDIEDLARLLEKHRHARRKLIVTDAVFSMDGDYAPLTRLVKLKRRYGAMLMVDEAHSGGLYGRRGQGLSHALGIQDSIDVHMGTFSKAFGVYGAYVSGNQTLIRWLTNKMRPFIYSTALPPTLIAAVSASLKLVQSSEGEQRRSRLHAASRSFRLQLAAAGHCIAEGDSPIVPLVVGDNRTALEFSKALEVEGIAAAAIRPPTVPEGTARLRFSLSAAHSDDELNDAAQRICRIGSEIGATEP